MSHPANPFDGITPTLPPSPVVPTVRYNGKRGRPKIVLPIDQIAALATIQCTLEEIAYCTGVTLKTLQRNKDILRVIDENRAKGHMSVKRAHFKAATAGEAWAVVHWDKKYHGFQDRGAQTQLPDPNAEPALYPVVIMLPHDGRDDVDDRLMAIPEAEAHEVLKLPKGKAETAP